MYIHKHIHTYHNIRILRECFILDYLHYMYVAFKEARTYIKLMDFVSQALDAVLDVCIVMNGVTYGSTEVLQLGIIAAQGAAHGCHLLPNILQLIKRAIQSIHVLIQQSHLQFKHMRMCILMLVLYHVRIIYADRVLI